MEQADVEISKAAVFVLQKLQVVSRESRAVYNQDIRSCSLMSQETFLRFSFLQKNHFRSLGLQLEVVSDISWLKSNFHLELKSPNVKAGQNMQKLLNGETISRSHLVFRPTGVAEVQVTAVITVQVYVEVSADRGHKEASGSSGKQVVFIRKAVRQRVDPL